MMMMISLYALYRRRAILPLEFQHPPCPFPLAEMAHHFLAALLVVGQTALHSVLAHKTLVRETNRQTRP